MRWWYIKYQGYEDFLIADHWESPPPEQKDPKLAEYDAAWEAQSHNERVIRNMFVIDDDKPAEEILRRGGIVDGSVWPIWNITSEERVRLSIATAPTIMSGTS